MNFGEVVGGLPELNRVLHRAMSIQHSSRGLGWEYLETRPTGDELRVAYYRDFESDQAFNDALDQLRTWLGDNYAAAEVPCVSAYDDQMGLEEA